MQIAKEGFSFLFGCLFFALAFGVAGLWLPAFFPLAAILLALAGFVAYFFRDPERAIPTEPDIIVSPADGKITRVAKVEPENPRSPTLVSIFLSPLDVHINRAPMPGVVRDVLHKPGKFINAMSDSASLVNEQIVVTLENERLTVVFKQIAGFIARRCVLWKKPGERVALGERVGLIKFSSRTDLIVPPEVSVIVKPGERVVGGATIIGRIHRS
jgi:phosphatidylserine decarboxylase